MTDEYGDWYWCETCEVVGKGETCWSCTKSTALVRRGPKVDLIVFDLILSQTAHEVRFAS